MRTLRRYGREMVRLGPPNNDRLAALRVGLGVTVPVLVLLLAGRPELTIYAVFGAFAGMYGRGESHQLRVVHQGQAAAVLLTGVSLGVLLSIAHVPHWQLVAIEACFAALGSLLADRIRLQPAGPFFGIFALGACASVPAAVPLWAASLICAGSALFSMAVGFAGWVRKRSWNRDAKRPAEPLTGEWMAGAGVHAARYLIAVAAAGTVGLLSGVGHAQWAMAAAAVPLVGADLPSRVRRGVHRILGTFAGIGITAVLLVFAPGPALLAVLLMVFLFPTELFMTRHYGIAMTFFTPVILLMIQLADPAEPSALLVDRGLETLIGAVVGIAVVVLIRRHGTRRSPAG